MLVYLSDEFGLIGRHLNKFRGYRILAGDKAQTGYQELHIARGFQHKTVCGHDIRLRKQGIGLGIEIGMQVGYQRRLFFLSHQHHHICRQSALTQHGLHVIEHRISQVLFGALRERAKLHVSAFFLVGLIESLQALGCEAFVVDARNKFLLVEIGCFVMGVDMLEEAQIEPDDLLATPEVPRQGGEALIDSFIRQLVLSPFEARFFQSFTR